jgi:transposase
MSNIFTALSWRDVAIGSCIALVLAGASYAGSNIVPQKITSYGYFDKWYDGDLPRVYSTMAERFGDGHESTRKHPLFLLASQPAVSVAKRAFGIGPAVAIKLVMALLAYVSVLVLYTWSASDDASPDRRGLAVPVVRVERRGHILVHGSGDISIWRARHSARRIDSSRVATLGASIWLLCLGQHRDIRLHNHELDGRHRRDSRVLSISGEPHGSSPCPWHWRRYCGPVAPARRSESLDDAPARRHRGAHQWLRVRPLAGAWAEVASGPDVQGEPRPGVRRQGDRCRRLYLHPPEHAIVLSVDEKTSIQALERTQRPLPLRAGRAVRHTHDYRRHGVLDLFAALEIATGKVTHRFSPTHTGADFLRFMRKVARAYPDRDLHVVLDNSSTHNTEEVRAWLAANPRVQFHYTPTSASWLNQIEGFFGILTRQSLAVTDFASRRALQDHLCAYLRAWNKQPTPFEWTKPAKAIVASHKRMLERISTAVH